MNLDEELHGPHEIRLTQKQVDRVVEELLGTRHIPYLGPILGSDFEELLLEDLHRDSVANVTDRIERCESCDWWCERSELNEDMVCELCASGEEQ